MCWCCLIGAQPTFFCLLISRFCLIGVKSTLCCPLISQCCHICTWSTSFRFLVLFYRWIPEFSPVPFLSFVDVRQTSDTEVSISPIPCPPFIVASLRHRQIWCWIAHWTRVARMDGHMRLTVWSHLAANARKCCSFVSRQARMSSVWNWRVLQSRT